MIFYVETTWCKSYKITYFFIRFLGWRCFKAQWTPWRVGTWSHWLSTTIMSGVARPRAVKPRGPRSRIPTIAPCRSGALQDFFATSSIKTTQVGYLETSKHGSSYHNWKPQLPPNIFVGALLHPNLFMKSFGVASIRKIEMVLSVLKILSQIWQ